MKVLQVVPGIAPSFGGPSVALIELTRALRLQGIDAEIYTTNADPTGAIDVPLGRAILQSDVPVTYFNVWPPGRYSFSATLAQSLIKNISRQDIVHIHWLYNFSSLAAAVAAARAGVPYVLQVNGSLDPFLMRKNTAMKRAYLALAGRYMMNRAAALIFTTEAERRDASFHSSRVPTQIVPVGLNWQEFNQLPPRGEFRRTIPELGDRRIILFLGRISPQKGLDLLIPAFARIAHDIENVHLVLAGPDNDHYAARVREWVESAGLRQRVTFTGRVPDGLKLAAYVDSEVFVLPSHAENFGATVTEAMACRCPVVISDRVNVSGEIAEADAGIVVPRLPEAIAAGIRLVLEDRVRAEELARNGWNLVRRRFTWDAALETLVPLYESVIRQSIRRTKGKEPS